MVEVGGRRLRFCQRLVNRRIKLCCVSWRDDHGSDFARCFAREETILNIWIQLLEYLCQQVEHTILDLLCDSVWSLSSIIKLVFMN